MNVSKNELMSVLSQFNPWWGGETIADLPSWQRASFQELFNWVYSPQTPRAILLSGARQVGKTTLLLQAIDSLLKKGVSPSNILYATFDHPIIKMSSIDAVLEAWREREPKAHGAEYLFLDEAQFIRDWGTWVKHQVDFNKERRIIFTGSAMPLIYAGQESGYGRLHTIKLTTLSFYEYLELKKTKEEENIKSFISYFKKFNSNNKLEKISNLNFTQNIENIKSYNPKDLFKEIPFKPLSLPKLPALKSLRELFSWPEHEFYRVSELAAPYVGHFHEYLIRGGFPETAKIENTNQAQRLLREDIIDKALKRDMTALFGVRNILELEQTFLYLCMNDGGLLDMPDLCGNLEIKRPTAQSFIDLLERTHLIYRLQPFGYGKDILRAKYKIYLADAAIAPAVLLKGKRILEDDPSALGVATETAVFKHIFTHYYHETSVHFSYWRGKKNHEVDLIAEANNHIIPFEVKYRTQHTGARDLKGLLELCEEKSIKHGYVITKKLDDFGLLKNINSSNTQIMRVPATLLCYWMGLLELTNAGSIDN
jgi:predicted AAA+ superfamily ATPase